MRNKIGNKKVKKYRKQTGLPIITALTRGDTDHRIDLCLENGSVMHWYKDKTMELATIRWKKV